MKKILLTASFAAFVFAPAWAQDAPPAAGPSIGPAPAHTKQHEILTGALSSETRETLQKAMNSSDADHSAPASK